MRMSDITLLLPVPGNPWIKSRSGSSKDCSAVRFSISRTSSFSLRTKCFKKASCSAFGGSAPSWMLRSSLSRFLLASAQCHEAAALRASWKGSVHRVLVRLAARFAATCSSKLVSYMAPGFPRAAAGVGETFVNQTSKAIRIEVSCASLRECFFAAFFSCSAVRFALSSSLGSTVGACNWGITSLAKLSRGRVKGAISGSSSDSCPSLSFSWCPVGPVAANVCKRNDLMRAAADWLTTLPRTYSCHASCHCT